MEDETIRWTERMVQGALYTFCSLKHHEIVIPNSCVFGWESDLVSVTRAGLITEFEIKISRADFKADARKWRSLFLERPVERRPDGRLKKHVANYFYYVVPQGLIAAEEVPEYAGLLYVRAADGRLFHTPIVEVKVCRKLHGEKITEKQRRQIARSMTRRFWRYRLNEVGK